MHYSNRRPNCSGARCSALGLALLVIGSLLACSQAGVAATWHVSPGSAPGGDGSGWGSAMASLAPAFTKARPGDEIWVRSGTLTLAETLRLPSGIALYGGFTGNESTTAARRGINFANETVLRISPRDASVVEIVDGADVRLDGFSLAGANGKSGMILRRCAPTVVLANLRITGNRASEPGAGLAICHGSHPRLQNVQIANNRAIDGADGGGLFIDETSGVDWKGGIINGNIADGLRGGGAVVRSASAGDARLVDCHFYFNEAGANGSALDVTGKVELHNAVICSNLARAAQPGAALAVSGPDAHVVLRGDSYITGNLGDVAAPRFVPGLEGAEHCELREGSSVGHLEDGRADISLFTDRNDVHTVMPDVFPAPLTDGPPSPGQWVRQQLPAREATAAYHCVYLPTDWEPGKTYPLLVTFPGNGPFRSRFGDISGGMPEDNVMGIGLSGGQGWVVLGLGYLDSRKQLQPTGQWWGDVAATIDYTKEAVRFVCANYGADAQRIILLGFSRSAIGAGFVGLNDDTIAPLWRGILCYDGWERQEDMARNRYGYDKISYSYDPNDFDGTGAARRFERLAGRPLLVVGGRGDLESLRRSGDHRVEFLGKSHRNHSVLWTLRDTPERAKARAWLDSVVSGPRP
jgi:hypothetical protein